MPASPCPSAATLRTQWFGYGFHREEQGTEQSRVPEAPRQRKQDFQEAPSEGVCDISAVFRKPAHFLWEPAPLGHGVTEVWALLVV